MSGRRRGVLLVNLGTPASPAMRDVRRYLRQFLGDPRVLDRPAVARALLLYGAILPFRSRRSAQAYATIWTPEGSPLCVHGRALRDALAKALGPGYAVELAMRYGEPAMGPALDRLAAADVDAIEVVPLFPQAAASSSGSALEAVYGEAGRRWNVPPLRARGPFYDEPGFVRALAAVADELPAARRPDHLLVSFHGLPERQVRRSDPSGAHCLVRERCCDAIGPANRHCYRAQCFATARALAGALGLAPDEWSVGFQSRLGRTPWIRPYTDERLPELAARGVRVLGVVCPSFVADCLETLEEIGIRAREQWRALGGEELVLLPCVNAHPVWVEALAGWIRTGGART
jgi:ferrochelatase